MKKTIKRSFEESKIFVHSLNLQNTYEWFAYAKSGMKPNDIPGSPAGYYRDTGWISWYDWLGKNHSRKKSYLPFESARMFVRALGLKSTEEWIQYFKSESRPHDIPSAPNVIYKNKGWKSIKDWLGTENLKGNRYRPFEQAREFVRSLGLRNQHDWAQYSKSGNRPRDIPSAPNIIYKDAGWKSIGNWLGTEYAHGSKFLPFGDARNFVRSLGFENQKEWFAYSRSGARPKYIPSSPYIVYKDNGWVSWTDWIRKI